MSGPYSERVVAATDGSCLGNPGKGGWCWYIDEDRWASGHAARTTNNRMEILALIELLEELDPAVAVLVQADSRYVIDAVTKWLPNWKRRGWRTASGGEVKNMDLFQRLDDLLTGRVVTFEHVYGHSGHPANERADTLARAAATSQHSRRSGQR